MKSVHNKLPEFQQFQMAFGQHLRDPHHIARPAGTSRRGAAVYGELLFNNIKGFLDPCFPVSRQLLGASRWHRLVRGFFRDWRCRTPWFREIPREFVAYLGSGSVKVNLPPWLPQLAHYEWAELAVDVMEVTWPVDVQPGNLLVGIPLLNPARMELAYDWPVHRIGPDDRPRRPTPTCLLVYRDGGHGVRFLEINPVSGRLLALLASGTLTGRAACLQVAQELGRSDGEVVVSFGRKILEELLEMQVILGVKP